MDSVEDKLSSRQEKQDRPPRCPRCGEGCKRILPRHVKLFGFIVTICTGAICAVLIKAIQNAARDGSFMGLLGLPLSLLIILSVGKGFYMFKSLYECKICREKFRYQHIDF